MVEIDTMLYAFKAGECEMRDNSLLGNVLALGSRLMAEGRIPQDVAEGVNGAFALCLVRQSGTEIKTLHSGDELEVGRTPEECKMLWAIDDLWMSRRHFRIMVEETGVASLHCLGARNGTFVNDQAVEGSVSLRRGDVIRVGYSTLLLL